MSFLTSFSSDHHMDVLHKDWYDHHVDVLHKDWYDHHMDVLHKDWYVLRCMCMYLEIEKTKCCTSYFYYYHLSLIQHSNDGYFVSLDDEGFGWNSTAFCFTAML